ncbi:hypothetical protein K2Z83_22440 [Oscillochloris sp. ZM17-4]|uniref:C25 family cysteine peptidase n=1 Tax=Oscillochloris sp. ZM17-4 TaxID=2866714 RepID=UPI001C734A17|nr:C25 family cysteine peptidase [Oscillochloris sp. ZM17-4]MBX0330423.1 hypothetical protein [Oscillochloris sp. ZM17-4]
MTTRTLLAIALLLVLLSSAGASARPRDPGGLSVTADARGLTIRWSPDSATQSALASGAPPPPQVIAVELPDGADPSPIIIAVDHQPWAGASPSPTTIPTRTLPDGTSYPPLAQFGPTPAPAAPLALLREGRARGQRIAVYALSPVYIAGDGPTMLTGLDARIPNAAPLAAADAWETHPNTPFLDAAPSAPDPIAAGQSWVIRVSQGGVQSLSAAALQAAGLSLAGVSPSRLRLWMGGAAVPLELRTSGAALDELRFYAPTPGDRYNSTDTYWLTVEDAAVPTMATVSAPPTGSVTCQSTALGQGAWQTPSLYDPQIPGTDGDHFFAARLRVGSLTPVAAPPDVLTATISPDLPRATGPVTVTISGASLFADTHTISVTVAGAVRTSSWFGTPVFTRSLGFPAGSGQVEIALMPVAAEAGDGIHIDSVSWQTPVQLSFAGKGAAFVGQSGHRCYSLSGLPVGAALYDVTSPAAPARMSIGASSFEVSVAEGRSYILAGPGTLHTPEISAHAPINLATPLDAQAIYIAPDAFVSALDPLVAQRKAQGYSVVVVRAQAIYDSWAGGQASPAAIRDFLRYAAAAWSVKPIAVTLVGDGTYDPRNYLGIGQTSWIPPYLAEVDPWLGETACENCFAQLDGDSPLSDPLPDLMIGRLPVKSAEELGQLAQKIIAYENAQDIGAWRGRAVYLADNADSAGDFTQTADASVAELPSAAKVTRVYYDPAAPDSEPWRVRDSFDAFQRSFDAINGGAAVVSYLGHGQPYQWAYTGPPLTDTVPQDRQYLLNVDFAGDLTNSARLPVVLSLTCLTGEFQIPSVRGTTIDEALVLNPHGGAIATWSSSGLGVLYGHDALQKGFLDTLWAAPTTAPERLGAMAMAGYEQLFTTKSCCQDALRTYGVLGDPLTPVRTQTGVSEVALPIVRR